MTIQSSELKSDMSDEDEQESIVIFVYVVIWFAATIFFDYFWQINNPASLVM